MSRFSLGDRPLSQALRACTISASQPAATTPRASVSSATSGSWSSMPMRHLTVTGIDDRALHRRDASRHQLRLRHQAGAEAAGLHPIGRAADIEVDLVIAEILADPRGLRELARIGPAKLQRHRMLDRVEPEQPLAVAMHDGAGRHHLRIEQRPPRQHADGRPGNAGRSSPSWAAILNFHFISMA